MADNFKVPGSSYEELVKIIRAYASGKPGQAQALEVISQATGIDKTNVSRNNGFLVQVELLTQGNKKTPTEECLNLGRAYSLNIEDEIRRIWKCLVENSEFLSRMLSAIKIRNGMDKTSLISHILYSAGASVTANAKAGANTIIEIFKIASLVEESDGKITAISDIASIANISVNESLTPKSKTEVSADIATQPVALLNKELKSGIVNVNINVNIEVKPTDIDDLSDKIKALLDTIND